MMRDRWLRAGAPAKVLIAPLRTITPWMLAAWCAGCAHPGGAPRDVTSSMAPAADSITLALYHLDEPGGSSVADSGPYRFRGTAGTDARTDFGRFNNARVFQRSIESWVYVPYSADLDSRRLTAEAWIEPEQLGIYEDTPIACRWTEFPGEQSWMFTVVGLQRDNRLTSIAAPGFHESFLRGATPGRLMFVFQPAEPGPPQVYLSAFDVPLNRWTHVAVTLDGEAVRFFVNGQLDAQYATRSLIRDSLAPLLIGNYFDTRKLSDFSGELRTGGRVAHPPVYAFQGMIDELRISAQARASLGVAR